MGSVRAVADCAISVRIPSVVADHGLPGRLKNINTRLPFYRERAIRSFQLNSSVPGLASMTVVSSPSQSLVTLRSRLRPRSMANTLNRFYAVG